MSIYHFKTNLKCSGCVDTLKPHLDKMAENGDIENWSVDLQSPEKILMVETNKLTPERVKHEVRAAGYDADFTFPPQAHGRIG